MALPILVGSMLAAGVGVAGVGVAATHFFTSAEKTMYDAVVKIDSLLAVANAGWTVKFKPVEPVKYQKFFDFFRAPPVQREEATVQVEQFQKLEDVYGTSVGVIGMYNRGKTWLINKLCQTNFDSGDMVKTEGLSMMCPSPSGKDGKNLIMLDTAGADTPVPEDNMEDIQATEAFLRELVIQLSTILIVVVNRLRRSDQRFLTGVLKATKNMKIRLLCVHNLDDVSSIKDLEKQINEDIIKCYHAQPDTMRVGNKTAEFYRAKGATAQIEHFVVAKDRTEAGNKVNELTFEAIRMVLQTDNNRRSLNIFPDIIKYADNRLRQLFEGQPEIRLQLVDNPPRFHCSALAEGGFKYIPKISFVDGLMIDSINIQNVNHWEPRYRVREPDQQTFEVLVDLAGSTWQRDLKIEQQMEKLIITGSRVLDDSGIVDSSDIPTGPYTLNVHLSKRCKANSADVTVYNGMYKIIVQKETQNEEYRINLRVEPMQL